MTTISDWSIVRCKRDRASQYLLQYLGSLPRTKGGERMLRLYAFGTGAAGQQRALMSHDAHVTFKRAEAGRGLEFGVHVNWVPMEAELLPSFHGLFRLQNDEHYGQTRLVIEGTYEPPLRVIGKVFDAVAGKRIAHGTLRRLLSDISQAIETAGARDTQH